MERFWVKHYPPGVPAEIDIDEYASLRDMLEATFANYPTRPAFTSMGRSLSFRELDAQSAAFGAWLQAKGCVKGTRVALMMPNILQYPVALFGALRAGCTIVNVNPLYTARELACQLQDSGAEVIVVVENFAHTVEAARTGTALKHVVVTSIGEMLGVKGLVVDFVIRRVKKLVKPWSLPGAIRFRDALREGRKLPLARVPLGHDDIAFLQYTGGTTGVAKGAVLLHRNMIANLLQARAWLRPFLGTEQRDVIITPLPLYHIFSLTANCLVFMTLGGENVLIANPRDIPAMVRTMRHHRVTAITGVNTLFNALLANPEFAKLDFSTLRMALGGGMAVQEAVAKRWKDVTGVTLVEAYGLTETAPAATVNPLNIPAYNGSIGLPIPSTDIVLRDDRGDDVPRGEPGEICIRGPQVMAGYWNKPEETALVMTPDGFLATGDIGVQDERGYIRIIDRKKDMILVSGFNVYPNEIEGVVAMHPGVLECAAVGVPDAHSGEAVKLFIVPKDAGLTPDALLAYCARSLTAYKRPRQVVFTGELPKSNVGKILRRELRDENVRAAA